MPTFKVKKRLIDLFVRFCRNRDIMESPYNLLTFLYENDLIKEDELLAFIASAEKKKEEQK